MGEEGVKRVENKAAAEAQGGGSWGVDLELGVGLGLGHEMRVESGMANISRDGTGLYKIVLR